MNRLISIPALVVLVGGCGGGEAVTKTLTGGQGSTDQASASASSNCHALGMTSAARTEGTSALRTV